MFCDLVFARAWRLLRISILEKVVAKEDNDKEKSRL